MSRRKRGAREAFREVVMRRAAFRCETLRPDGRRCSETAVGVHHIVSRDVMPAGGYIASNGIACCFGCHDHAERDALDPGGLYSPARLRAAIGETPRELADLLLALDLGRALTREQKTGLRLLAGDISPTKWVAWSAATIAADWRDLACATGAADWTEQRAARER